ncbi:hypothetical protein ACFTAO_14975 [Paenibacillus rhizoplanae]
MMKRRFDPATLERPAKFAKLTGPYADTKLALSLWTAELAPALAAEGIMIRSADPGGNNTMRSGKKIRNSLLAEAHYTYVLPGAYSWSRLAVPGCTRRAQP